MKSEIIRIESTISSRMRPTAMLRVAHLLCITHILGEGGNGEVFRASLEHLDMVGQGCSLIYAVPSAVMQLNHHNFTTNKLYQKEQRSHQGKTCLLSYLS